MYIIKVNECYLSSYAGIDGVQGNCIMTESIDLAYTFNEKHQALAEIDNELDLSGAECINLSRK